MKFYKYFSLSCLALVIALVVWLGFSNFFPDFSQDGFGENKIMIRYDSIGCGSIFNHVVKGGKEIFEKAELPIDENTVFEVNFTEDSDNPLKHFLELGDDSAPIYGYEIIVYGEVVGSAESFLDCCPPENPNEEKAPLFKISRWAPAVFMPYEGDFLLPFCLVALVLFVFLVISFITLIKYIIKKALK